MLVSIVKEGNPRAVCSSQCRRIVNGCMFLSLYQAYARGKAIKDQGPLFAARLAGTGVQTKNREYFVIIVALRSFGRISAQAREHTSSIVFFLSSFPNSPMQIKDLRRANSAFCKSTKMRYRV